MPQSIAKVHLNNEEVVTLCMKKSYRRVNRKGRVKYELHRRKATVNGKKVPWDVAEQVFAECLKAGVIPEMDCGR